ncbi:MAG: translocation/assembly module TamB domain-containing protein [Tannerellaceae bacterium]|jgi:hypothetical protein|nr:translocation/assembly module TamB domain-containing protein [Tannerellaceae bacterium]
MKRLRFMTGLRHGVVGLIAFPALVYLTPTVLLLMPPVQEWLRSATSSALADKLGTAVEIGALRLEWPARLRVERLAVNDRYDAPLIKADYLSVRFQLLPLIGGRVVVDAIRLSDFALFLDRDTATGTLNAQFVVDAFKGSGDGGLDIELRSLLLRKGRVCFAPMDLECYDLAAKLSATVLGTDTFCVRLESLSFSEGRGFRLEDLHGMVAGNASGLSVQDVELRLPRSSLWLSRAQIDTTELSLVIKESVLCPADIDAFVPAFRHFTDSVRFSATVGGRADSLHLADLHLTIGRDAGCEGNLSVSHILSDSMRFSGVVTRLFVTPQGFPLLVSGLGGSGVQLPSAMVRLGRVSFAGDVTGSSEHIRTIGRFSSAVGALETDLTFGRSHGDVALTVDGDMHLVTQRLKAHSSGKATFRRNGDFDAALSASVDGGLLQFDGSLRRTGQAADVGFSAAVCRFPIDGEAGGDISFDLSAGFSGRNLDDVTGTLRVDDMALLTPTDSFFLSRLSLSASVLPTGRRLVVSSDLLNGELTGDFSFTGLLPHLQGLLEAYLPALLPPPVGGNAVVTARQATVTADNFSFLFTLGDMGHLAKALQLPFVLEAAQLSGFCRGEQFRFELRTPHFRVGQAAMEGGYLLCENPHARALLSARATLLGKDVRNYFSFKASAFDDVVHADLNWANDRTNFSGALLSGNMFFFRDEGLRTEIEIDESRLYVSDTLWRILPASFSVYNGRVDIDHFAVEHNDLHLRLDGTISPDPADVLLLKMHKLELSYIFDILNIPNLRFGGEATGSFLIRDPYGSRIVQTDNFTVDNFSLNDGSLGKLQLYSEWDEAHRGILLLGSIYTDDSTWTDVNGYIFPVKPESGLSLHFNANDLNLSFLRPFLRSAVSGFSGRASGPVHLFGPFSALSLAGNAAVKDVHISFDFLGTEYVFSDSVRMDDEGIFLDDVALHDRDGNTAQADFAFRHRFFQDYTFSGNLFTDRLLVYNCSERLNPMIYGSMYGAGTLYLSGNDRRVDFNINLRSGAHSFAGFNFTNVTPTEGNGLLRFVPSLDEGVAAATERLHAAAVAPPVAVEVSMEKQQTPPIEGDAKQPAGSATAAEQKMEIFVDILLDVTPEATLELVLDPVAGDRLRGHAAGAIHLLYNPRSDLRMFGTANIVEGEYNFSLQQLFRRNFKIRDGSTVAFQGDPMDATLDVRAVYTLSANIGDLDPGLLVEADRTNLPVNCVLVIKGDLQRPALSFDIELPGANAEIERQVRSFINTEDMMARQIIYLIALNKFYTPSYSMSERSGELSAVASATLSSQLSGLLNAISDKVQIGANIHSSYEGMDDTEMEMLLSSQLLDNRLIFNGNFGYRNSYSLGKSVLVGEFDVEYKLSPMGEIRLKAYNHANDMYRYLTQSRTTQGFGILLKKDFSTLPELLRKRKRRQQ